MGGYSGFPANLGSLVELSERSSFVRCANVPTHRDAMDGAPSVWVQ